MSLRISTVPLCLNESDIAIHCYPDFLKWDVHVKNQKQMSFTVTKVFSLLSTFFIFFNLTFLSLHISSFSCYEYSKMLNKTRTTFRPV
jgi:hypothetical protein